MMVKGTVIKRKGREVKQFGVSLKGTVRLVTSGDTVDRETYEALLAAGAIAPRTQPAQTEPDAAAEPIEE